MSKPYGQKSPLTLDQIKKITDFLISKSKWRDLAMFTLAIDSLLRSSEIRHIRVSDVQDVFGQVPEVITLRQQKTKEPITFTLSPFSQNAIQYWINYAGLTTAQFLFPSPRGDKPISRYHFRCLIKGWVLAIGLPPDRYAGHSLRRTKAKLVYEETKDYEKVRLLLGHKGIGSVVHYLGIHQSEALEAAKDIKAFPMVFPKLPDEADNE